MPSAHTRGIINEIFRRISTNNEESIDIASIIAQYSIAPATAIRAYKETFAKTPAKHHKQMLMDYAKLRIQQGIQIKSVAVELGYKSTASFSRAFKRVFKHAPSESLSAKGKLK